MSEPRATPMVDGEVLLIPSYADPRIEVVATWRNCPVVKADFARTLERMVHDLAERLSDAVDASICSNEHCEQEQCVAVRKALARYGELVKSIAK